MLVDIVVVGTAVLFVVAIVWINVHARRQKSISSEGTIEDVDPS